MKYWTNLLFDEGGTTAVEYAVMLGMILLTAFASIAVFGQQAGGMWNSIGGNLTSHGF